MARAGRRRQGLAGSVLAVRRSQGGTSPGPPWSGGGGSFGVGDELLELGRGGETATQPCDGCAEGVGGGDVLEVLVGLYGEGGALAMVKAAVSQGVSAWA